jgi:hypothetical protein
MLRGMMWLLLLRWGTRRHWVADYTVSRWNNDNTIWGVVNSIHVDGPGHAPVVITILLWMGLAVAWLSRWRRWTVTGRWRANGIRSMRRWVVSDVRL